MLPRDSHFIMLLLTNITTIYIMKWHHQNTNYIVLRIAQHMIIKITNTSALSLSKLFIIMLLSSDWTMYDNIPAMDPILRNFVWWYICCQTPHRCTPTLYTLLSIFHNKITIYFISISRIEFALWIIDPAMGFSGWIVQLIYFGLYVYDFRSS